MIQPFYDPLKSYYDNYNQGPFGAFADSIIFKNEGKPDFNFFGIPVYKPFGIPAGPLVNSNFVIAALNKGFDIPVYKTVRTRAYPCHQWPNVLAVHLEDKLTLERAQTQLVADNEYLEPLSITNSFGVPSSDPDVWQKDMARCVSYAKNGQVVVGSFQGTKQTNGSVQAYIDDFITAARLVKETGTRVLEVNLSCPNEGTANLLCFDAHRVREIAHAIKNEIGNTPLILKIGYFENSEALRLWLQIVGSVADGFAAINTIAAPIIDAKGNQALPGEGRERSGVCGTAIQWAGLEMVKQLALFKNEFGMSYTIVGVGGVMKLIDFKKYRDAGADIVMSATGAMWNPYLAQDIKT